MRDRSTIAVVTLGFAALLVACFSPVLFHGRQFGFRDAGHFYYPLYERVEQEWTAGRLPLWEMEENAGMPLLGNPTAAVLYPLKLIYTALPYAWAARVYVVAHTALAFAAMLVLLRSWRASWTGSGIAALAYAFGAPVLFQSCNVIYLVGAAWMPLGLHAVDRWVRLGRRWAVVELAIVLAMQTLGGEPQSAYLVGISGLGYAAGLAWARRAEVRSAPIAEPAARTRPRPPSPRVALTVILTLLGWIAVTLILASWLPRFREQAKPPRPLPWMTHVPVAVNVGWAAAGVVYLAVWRRSGGRRPFGVACLGLAGAAALAVALSAVQLLPVVEYTRLTIRAADAGTHEIYPFSLEPVRLAGLVWPGVLGSPLAGNTSWADYLHLPGAAARVWVPSLYLGAATLALALGTLRLRGGEPWRIWLSVVAIVSGLGSLGLYTSPIWAARAVLDGGHGGRAAAPGSAAGQPVEPRAPANPLSRLIGPLDPEGTSPIRQDGYLRDGDGGLYWMLSTLLPGFRQFRFPAKLFTLTSLALAALGGLGWDTVTRGDSRRAATATIALLGTSAILLASVLLLRPWVLAWFRSMVVISMFGPFDSRGAYGELAGGLLQGTAVLALGLAAIRLARRWPGWAGLLLLCVAAADLAAGNARLIITVPQDLFEGQPELLRVIEEAERKDPQPGPFRVHRLSAWEPIDWSGVASPDRAAEIVHWERQTLQPKYGVPLGVEYANVVGVAELYEYEWFYGGFTRAVTDRSFARLLNIRAGDPVFYFPRRTFDMWNVRYFIMPMWPNGWTDAFRGFASVIIESEPIYPPPSELRGPDGEEKREEWYRRRDYQVFRNRRAHPRAWVVHAARVVEAGRGQDPAYERQQAMQEITYDDDPIWSNPSRPRFDWRRMVWIDADQRASLAAFLPGDAPRASESVTVHYPTPQRVELDVSLESPGLVVLADVYYPGWELTIDGVPSPIHRVNRIMRGAAVSKGSHHLVYRYHPLSFRVGLVLSVLGIIAVIAVSVFFRFRPSASD